MPSLPLAGAISVFFSTDTFIILLRDVHQSITDAAPRVLSYLAQKGCQIALRKKERGRMRDEVERGREE
jgi:hypothetical protein